MRALFVGGAVDNSELDMDGTSPPKHYPASTGGGQPRYSLHHVGERDGVVAYAVYAAPGLADSEVERGRIKPLRRKRYQIAECKSDLTASPSTPSDNQNDASKRPSPPCSPR